MPQAPKIKSVSGRSPNRPSPDASERYMLVQRDIFQRAMTLFDKDGFRGTTMQDIADACGVTKPTIYYYFRDKHDLLQHLYESVTREFYQQTQTLLRSPAEPDEKLRCLIRMQVFYSVEHRQFQRLFQRERHELKEPVRSAIAKCERDYERTVEEVIRDGQSKGIFRPMTPRLAMMIILGALSSVHRWGRHVNEEPAAIAEAVVTMVLDGLSA